MRQTSIQEDWDFTGGSIPRELKCYYQPDSVTSVMTLQDGVWTPLASSDYYSFANRIRFPTPPTGERIQVKYATGTDCSQIGQLAELAPLMRLTVIWGDNDSSNQPVAVESARQLEAMIDRMRYW